MVQVGPPLLSDLINMMYKIEIRQIIKEPTVDSSNSEGSKEYHSTAKFTKYTPENRNRKDDLKNVPCMSTDKEISTIMVNCYMPQHINNQSVPEKYELTNFRRKSTKFVMKNLHLDDLIPTQTEPKRILEDLDFDINKTSQTDLKKNQNKCDLNTTTACTATPFLKKSLIMIDSNEIQDTAVKMSVTDTEFSNMTDSSSSQNIQTESLTNRRKVVQDLTTAKLPTSQLDKSLPALSKENDSSNVLGEPSFPKRQSEEKYINEETKFPHPLTERTKCVTRKQEQTKSLKQSSRRKLVFLFLMLCVSKIKAQDCSVFWNISTSVNIGEDVTLKCKFQADDSSQCIGYPRWEGGPLRQIISLNNDVLPDPSRKYSIKISPGEYDLIIRNITEEDLNSSYTCHKRFAYYKAVLREKLTTVELTTIKILKETVPKKSAVHIPSTKSPPIYADIMDNTNNVNNGDETDQTVLFIALYVCLPVMFLVIFVVVAFVVYKRFLKKRGESQKSEYRSRTYRYTPTENKVEA